MLVQSLNCLCLLGNGELFVCEAIVASAGFMLTKHPPYCLPLLTPEVLGVRSAAANKTNERILLVAFTSMFQTPDIQNSDSYSRGVLLIYPWPPVSGNIGPSLRQSGGRSCTNIITVI